MANRVVTTAVIGALAIAGTASATATAAPQAARHHTISETQNIGMVATTGEPGTPSLRLIQAGVINGTIDAQPIHGALRATSKITSPSDSLVHGTEYDAGGSRAFVLHITFAISDQTVADTGTGRWVGGTGIYAHARGRFRINGTRPVNDAGAIELKGAITY